MITTVLERTVSLLASKKTVLKRATKYGVHEIKSLQCCGTKEGSYITGACVNSLHATGTFMCPRNASALRDRHIYVPSDVVQSYEENTKAKQAFGVNPFLLSSNKCRPHLSTYITRREGRKGRC